MKKTYMKPESAINIIHTRSTILEASPNVIINRYESVDAASVESRRRSTIWDDEEEE